MMNIPIHQILPVPSNRWNPQWAIKMASSRPITPAHGGTNERSLGLRYSQVFSRLPLSFNGIKHMLAIAPSLPPELKPKPELPSPHGGSLGVMGPNSTGTSKGEYLVTADDMINLVAGKAHFYSFGIIEYMDIFDTKHWTLFCYRSHALTDVDLVACSEWNEIDDN